MTIRKVQRIRNSYYIYLPKKWCQNHKIKQQTEVNLSNMDDGTLVVYPPNILVETTKETTIEIDSKKPRSIQPRIVAAYINGYYAIRVTSREKFPFNVREKINTLARKLLGFEVIEEDDHYILLRDISLTYELLSILRREYIILKFMLEGLKTCIETKSKKDAQVIIKRDDDVDRYRYAVERLSHIALQDTAFRSKIKISPDSCIYYSMAGKYLERMGDHITSIAISIDKGNIPEKIYVKSIDKIIKIFDLVTKSFFEKKQEEAFIVLNTFKEIIKEINEIEISKTNSKTRIIAYHLERLTSYCSDLAEISIDLTFGK
ncbi:MAG: PhoU domain-containing protein [Candidatus Ranarchaeia archaeon]